jgi:hypothetical protein
MTERKPHPDNDLIDAAQESAAPGAQGSASGGAVALEVGSRAEEHRAQGTLVGDEVERAQGSDNPARDERKGDKSVDHMVGGGSSPSR